MSQTPELRSRATGERAQPEPVARGLFRRWGPRDAQEILDLDAPFTRGQLGFLLATTVVAAALRLFNLSGWAFWVDEAHTFRDVVSAWPEFLDSGTSRYPLSFLLLRGMTALFGLGPEQLSEGVMRLPFAFFGIASVPVIAIVARGMVGRLAALLAAVFLAVSPWHIYWSQNARSYSMTLFFCLIAMGAFYHGLNLRSWKLVSAAVLSFALGGLSHGSANLVMAAALCYVLLAAFLHAERGLRFGKWGPLAVVALLAGLVLVSLPMLQRALEVGKAEFSLFHLVQTVVFYVGVPVLVAAAGGVLCLFDRGERSGPFLTCMVVVPLLVLLVLSSANVTVTAQYAFAVLPALYILAAVFLIFLSQVFQGRGLRPMVLRIVPLSMILFHMVGEDYLYFVKQHGWRPRWKEAVQYVQTHARLGGARDLLVLTTNAPSIRYYFDPAQFSGGYLERTDVEVVSVEEWHVRREGPEEYVLARIARARAAGKDLWVILSEPELQEKDVHGRVNAALRANLRQVRCLPNWTGPKDMVVLVYRLVD